MSEKEIIRQGDVLLVKIKRLPSGLSKKNKILAYGEATGHHHRFNELDDNVIVFTDVSGRQFVQIFKQESELAHEEHENIKVRSGIWEVRLQREYDIVEGIKRVLD